MVGKKYAPGSQLIKNVAEALASYIDDLRH